MSDGTIKLQYSGFLIFLAKLLSVITGMTFILMVTRSISPEEFGVWGNIRDVLLYFTLLAAVFPFWASRFMARKHPDAAKTGLVSNILIAIICIIGYSVLIPIITSVLQISEAYTILYIIISLQIIETYIMSLLESILRITKPQTVAYGLLIFEVCKVSLGYLLIIQLGMRLQGAVYSIIISLMIQTIFYFKLTKNFLKGRFNKKYLGEWVKGSVLNIYALVGNRLSTLALLFLFVYGRELARAFYGAAYSIASVIGYTFFLTYALYPKLLTEFKTQDVITSFKMFFMFAIPMTVGASVFATPYVTILEARYTIAAPILSILAVDIFCITLSTVIGSVIAGFEKLDEKAEIPMRDLLKSRLFKFHTLQYVKSLIILPTILIVLISTITMPLTMYPGDLNKDGVVNLEDINSMKLAYGTYPEHTHWNPSADINQDGVVGLLDIFPAVSNFGKTIAYTAYTATLYLVTVFLVVDISILVLQYILMKRGISFTYPWKSILKFSVAAIPMALFLLFIPQPTKLIPTLAFTLVAGGIYYLILIITDIETRIIAHSSLQELYNILRRVYSLLIRKFRVFRRINGSS